jgi:hypothetical protein
MMLLLSLIEPECVWVPVCFYHRLMIKKAGRYWTVRISLHVFDTRQHTQYAMLPHGCDMSLVVLCTRLLD